jgi:HD-GYP domain-containing protein (c-di-GMP phosphodiesterase class II)
VRAEPFGSLVQGMKTLFLNELAVGNQYDQSVFLPAGQKLIPARAPVESRHLDLLRKNGYDVVYLADTSDEVHIATGRRKARLERPEAPDIDPLDDFEEEDLDETIDQRKIKSRRIKMVDTLVEQLHERTRRLDLTIRPEEQEVWDFHHASGERWPDGDDLVRLRESMVNELRGTIARIEADEPVGFTELSGLVDRLYQMLLDHRVRFTQLALLVPRRDDFLADHVFCVAVLGMATAAQLIWSEQHIKLAGLTSLVQDLGMLLVPKRIRSGGEQLSDIDRGKVHRHTGYTLAMLAGVSGVPDEVLLAAYQHHERENGGGYPDGIREDGIYDLARILGVADVFAAQMSPRHYRRHALPYNAMEQMVRSAAANQFSKPAVRALVQAAGLFPVGSYVELSNRRSARVIAANPNHLDRPIIRLLDETRETVDLSKLPTETLAVVKPIPKPTDPPPTRQAA